MRSFGRIVVRVIGLTVIFALLIFLARAIGNVQPPPEALLALHLDDCQLPCWMGITPGETTFAEAAQEIKAAYPKLSPFMNNLGIDLTVPMDSSRMQISLLADKNDLVGNIIFNTDDFAGLAVGDVIALFAPHLTLVNQPPVTVFTVCPSYLVIVSAASSSTSWHQPLTMLNIQDTDSTCSASEP